MKYLIKNTVTFSTRTVVRYYGLHGDVVAHNGTKRPKPLTDERIRKMGYATREGAEKSWHYLNGNCGKYEIVEFDV